MLYSLTFYDIFQTQRLYVKMFTKYYITDKT